MSFLSKLYDIMNDMQNHKRNQQDVMSSCVSDRLDESLKQYIFSIDSGYKYLILRNSLNVLKKLESKRQ